MFPPLSWSASGDAKHREADGGRCPRRGWSLACCGGIPKTVRDSIATKTCRVFLQLPMAKLRGLQPWPWAMVKTSEQMGAGLEQVPTQAPEEVPQQVLG